MWSKRKSKNVNNVIMRPQTCDLQAHNLSFIILHYFGSFLIFIIIMSKMRWNGKNVYILWCAIIRIFRKFLSNGCRREKGKMASTKLSSFNWTQFSCLPIKKHPKHPEIWATMNLYFPALVDDHKIVEIDWEIVMLSSLDFVLLLQIFN